MAMPCQQYIRHNIRHAMPCQQNNIIFILPTKKNIANFGISDAITGMVPFFAPPETWGKQVGGMCHKL